MLAPQNRSPVFPDGYPWRMRIRLFLIRAFNDVGMMVDGDVVHGREAVPVIKNMLSSPSTSYLHIHNAKPGCYAARVDRA